MIIRLLLGPRSRTPRNQSIEGRRAIQALRILGRWRWGRGFATPRQFFRHSGANGTKLKPPRYFCITGRGCRASVAERRAMLSLAQPGAWHAALLFPYQ